MRAGNGAHPRAGAGLAAIAAPAVALLAAALCYRDLLSGVAAELDLEQVLFRPGLAPLGLVLAASAWLAWRRRAALGGGANGGSLGLAAPLALLGSGLLLWASATGALQLLLASAALNLWAFAAATAGRAGWRGMALPGGVLLAAAPLPLALQSELVWRLQLWTAAGAGWLLGALGQDFAKLGVILQSESHAFHVIDGCSGLSGIAILTLIALLIRELFPAAGRRLWIAVALAPAIGLAANIARVALVAARGGAADDDHQLQGLAVVIAGTALLYALTFALDRSAGRARPAARAAAPATPAPWRWLAAWLLALALGSALVPRLEIDVQGRPTGFPESAHGWEGRLLEHDLNYLGPLYGAGFSRRYVHGELDGPVPAIVDLLVGYEFPNRVDTGKLLTSKLQRPGPDWELARSGREQIWSLNREARVSLATRADGTHAVVFSWTMRDRGAWREAWRSWLALDWGPLRRERRRGVVRLVAYAPHDGSLVLDRARQRLDRFAAAFRSELGAL